MKSLVRYFVSFSGVLSEIVWQILIGVKNLVLESNYPVKISGFRFLDCVLVLSILQGHKVLSGEYLPKH